MSLLFLVLELRDWIPLELELSSEPERLDTLRAQNRLRALISRLRGALFPQAGEGIPRVPFLHSEKDPRS